MPAESEARCLWPVEQEKPLVSHFAEVEWRLPACAPEPPEEEPAAGISPLGVTADLAAAVAPTVATERAAALSAAGVGPAALVAVAAAEHSSGAAAVGK